MPGIRVHATDLTGGSSQSGRGAPSARTQTKDEIGTAAPSQKRTTAVAGEVRLYEEDWSKLPGYDE